MQSNTIQQNVELGGSGSNVKEAIKTNGWHNRRSQIAHKLAVKSDNRNVKSLTGSVNVERISHKL